MVTKNTIFSVLLPTHNRADVIGCAIESVLNQTFTNFELLIIGDGCTDNTKKIVKRYVEKDPRVFWFEFAKGAGFGYEHRNKILREVAKGKYIAYIGHDDIWLPNHLLEHHNFFRKNPDFLIVYSRPLWVSQENIILQSCFNTNNAKIAKIFQNQHNEIPAVCVVYRSHAHKKAGFWVPNSQKAGDWDLWKRIILCDPKKKFGFISTPTTLNFKANWRADDEYLSIQTTVLRDIILSSGNLEEKFTVKSSVKGNQPQQKIIWNKIANDPNWIATIRKNYSECADEIWYFLSLKIWTDQKSYENHVHNLTNTRGYKLLEKFRQTRAKTKKN